MPNQGARRRPAVNSRTRTAAPERRTTRRRSVCRARSMGGGSLSGAGKRTASRVPAAGGALAAALVGRLVAALVPALVGGLVAALVGGLVPALVGGLVPGLVA